MNAGKRGAEGELDREDEEKKEDTLSGNNGNVSGEGEGEKWSKASEHELASRKLLKTSHSSARLTINTEAEAAAPSVAAAVVSNTDNESGGGGGNSNDPFASLLSRDKRPPSGASQAPSTSSGQGFLAYANTNPFKSVSITPTNGLSSRSPANRVNPFSSTSPVVNPFMSFVEATKKEDLWNQMSKSSTSESSTSIPNKSAKLDKSPPELDTNSGAKKKNEDEEGEDGDEVAEESESPPLEGKAQQQQPVYTIASTGPVLTGEEEEDCVLELRVKLFRMDSKERSGWIDIGTGPVRILRPRSAPSSSSSTSSVMSPSTDAADQGLAGAKVGAGRVVMRRESHPGGHGTKLLLNVPLKTHVEIAKHGDRAVRLSYITSVVNSSASSLSSSSERAEDQTDSQSAQKVEAVTNILKTKTFQEADQLLKAMQSVSDNRLILQQ